MHVSGFAQRRLMSGKASHLHGNEETAAGSELRLGSGATLAVEKELSGRKGRKIYGEVEKKKFPNYRH